ncbi:MAG: FHA domain-containing protein [Zavarzinella sp.]
MEHSPKNSFLHAIDQYITASMGQATVLGLNVHKEHSASDTHLGATEYPFKMIAHNRKFRLRIGKNLIGRSKDNNIVINDHAVSRHHCVVVVHSNLRCELVDMASSNGTLLNGERVRKPTTIQPGDDICIGNERLLFSKNE